MLEVILYTGTETFYDDYCKHIWLKLPMSLVTHVLYLVLT